MTSAATSEEFRRANIELTRQVEASLDNFWSFLDLNDPAKSRNALLNYVPLLVQRYGGMAGTLAADWFEALRFDAIEEGYLARLTASTERSFAPSLAAPASVAVVQSDVHFHTRLLYGDEPERALSGLEYVVKQRVRDASRDTIRKNTFTQGSGASGWRRVTRPGACRFCRALAARGAVYKESTARFASHDPECNCAAEPAFDPEAPEVDVKAYVASENTAGMSKMQRARHRKQVSGWLEDEFPGETDHH